MDFLFIRNHRLKNQQLTETTFSEPEKLVSHFGAIQAQDYAMAKWAIGLRTEKTEKDIEDAINEGKIIRTHILRPTWHFVAAEDIHWMLELTAPSLKRLVTSAAVKMGLEDSLNAYNNKLQKLLSGNNHLTREEIMLELDIKTGSVNNISPVIIMMNAELEGIVCNGIMRGKKFTYASLEERVKPKNNKISKEEALAKLASKYFKSHGPATIQDFSWWSGLSLTNSRLALESIKSELASFQIEDKTYWFYEVSISNKDEEVLMHLLPAFDEFLISYKDRTASIALEHQPLAFTKNGIFNPVIALNGKIEGTWKRSIKKETVKIEINPINTFNNETSQLIMNQAKTYADYLGLKVEIA